jgi:hypothetical protein
MKDEQPMPTIQLKLKEASEVLGVAPKDLQNLVQFGVLRPQRKDRFFVFDSALLLEAKVAFYLKESLGTSVPLLARFNREIFSVPRGSKSGGISNVSILSRPMRGREAIKIEVPLRALAAELEALLPARASATRNGTRSAGWRKEISRAFERASDDLKKTSQKELLNEIKLYRAQRRKTPEITVVAQSQKKTA